MSPKINKEDDDEGFWWKLAKSRYLLPVLLIGLVLVGISLGKEIMRKYQVDQEISSLETSIADLEHRNQELNNLINYLQTDAYKEIQARKQLGLQKEGEVAISIQSDLTKPEISPENSDDDNMTEIKSNPRKWWDYFFQL